MNCACGSGEHDEYTGLRHCVEVMAKRLAAIEAKSAVPPVAPCKVCEGQGPVACSDHALCLVCKSLVLRADVSVMGLCRSCRRLPPEPAPTCEPTCGRNSVQFGRWLCTPACRDAGKPLNPKPEPQPAAAPAPDGAPENCPLWDILDLRHDGPCLIGATGVCEIESAAPVRIEAPKTAVPEPVSHERAVYALNVLAVDPSRTDWLSTLRRYVAEREAREVELEAALKTARAERDTRSELILQFDDRLRTVRAELAAERAKSAAPAQAIPPGGWVPGMDNLPKPPLGPAPGGTNRDRAKELASEFLNRTFGGPSEHHIGMAQQEWLGDKINALLDQVESAAESRGRNSAHGEKAKSLADNAKIIATAADALRVAEGRGKWSTDELPGNDVARARHVLRAVDIALAELAGTEGT